MKPALGVFGGMFDPVHDGHLKAALYAMDKLGLAEVLLIPCGVPNHRAAAASTGEHRMEMLRLATQVMPRIRLCDYEINKPDVSYTVDTLAWLKQEEPERTLVFLLGMDAFNEILEWHEWQEILALCNLLVLARSGLNVAEDVAMATGLGARLVESPEQLLQVDAGAIWIATDFEHDISSTRVRRMIESGEKPECVHEDVIGYIKEHRLYGQH